VRRTLYAVLGCVCGLAWLALLPYLFMATHDLFDALRGQLQADIGKWDPYAAVGLMAPLSFGALFMTFRLFHHAFATKSTD